MADIVFHASEAQNGPRHLARPSQSLAWPMPQIHIEPAMPNDSFTLTGADLNVDSHFKFDPLSLHVTTVPLQRSYSQPSNSFANDGTSLLQSFDSSFVPEPSFTNMLENEDSFSKMHSFPPRPLSQPLAGRYGDSKKFLQHETPSMQIPPHELMNSQHQKAFEQIRVIDAKIEKLRAELKRYHHLQYYKTPIFSSAYESVLERVRTYEASNYSLGQMSHGTDVPRQLLEKNGLGGGRGEPEELILSAARHFEPALAQKMQELTREAAETQAAGDPSYEEVEKNDVERIDNLTIAVKNKLWNNLVHTNHIFIAEEDSAADTFRSLYLSGWSPHEITEIMQFDRGFLDDICSRPLSIEEQLNIQLSCWNAYGRPEPLCVPPSREQEIFAPVNSNQRSETNKRKLEDGTDAFQMVENERAAKRTIYSDEFTYSMS